jgi:hypothetical protein
MANVLATLFGDIATAIRNKTGTTDKMSPKDFLIYINSITVNGGGGDNDNKEWKFASGEVIGAGGALTINHGLGVVPDIICVKAARNINDEMAYISGIQFSNAMITALNGLGTNDEKGLSYGYSKALGVVGLTITEGVEGSHAQFSGMFGHIRNANEITFTVGGGSVLPIPNDRKVTWWAVSGIT